MRRSVRWRRTRAAAAFTAALWAYACGGQGAGDGVVVRQVLRGPDALTQGAPAPEPARTAANAAGASQAIAPLGSTLVADTPQAVYRRALELARKDDGSVSPRARLAAIEAEIDQQQEELQ